MGRILAVDWDTKEVRFVLAKTDRRRGLRIVKCGYQVLSDVDATTLDPAGVATVAPVLAALLRAHKVGKTQKTIVVLSRANVELTPLVLPPATDTELPDILVNQMVRESAKYTEGSPLDFISLTTPATSQRHVLAAHLSRKEVAAVRTVCRKIRRPVQRITIAAAGVAAVILAPELRRPAAAVARIRPKSTETATFSAEDSVQTDEDTTTSSGDTATAIPTLVAAVGPDELSMAVLYNGRIAELRAVKLPSVVNPALTLGAVENTDAMAELVAAEITRTAVVGVPDVVPDSIGSIVLLGTETETETVRNILQTKTDRFLVETVNPLKTDGVASSLHLTETARFAPLIGTLLAEQLRVPHAIDFLHPKEKPKPVNVARIVVLAVLLFGAGLYGLYSWNSREIHKLQTEVAELEQQYQTVAGQYNQLVSPYQVLSTASTWEARGVNWLDEIRELSTALPSAQELVVTEMTFTSGPIPRATSYGGVIQLSGMVRDSTVLRQLEFALRSRGFYRVQLPTLVTNPGGGGYPYQFKHMTIYCARRSDPSTYLKWQPQDVQMDSRNYPENYPQSTGQ